MVSQSRHLLLMRHAKSSWANPSQTDHERPLNDRGMRDSPAMAQWLIDEKIKPDLILCSSARRTQQTTATMNAYWRRPVRTVSCKDLYHASATEILTAIRNRAELPELESAVKLMILAHNPGISELTSRLLGEAVAMPTAAIAVFDCQLTDWSVKLTRDNCRWLADQTPKQLSRDSGH